MKQLNHLIVLLSTILVVAVFAAGCGSSTTQKNPDEGEPAPTPSAALTGDVSLFPNWDLLASDEDIYEDGEVTAADDDIVLVDTRSAGAYAEGHIPGAVNLQWAGFAIMDGVPVKGMLMPDTQLAGALGAAGLTRTTNIIFYDDTTASWGSAGRFFWMLEYMGSTTVRILNGGFDKWKADGLPTETEANTLPAAEFIPVVQSETLADKEHIAQRLGDDDFVLVDTRTEEEYNGWQLYGEVRGGHIPGAVQLPYASYYNSDKTALGYSALKALFDANGITAGKEMAAYCTAGIRSGYLYFLGRLMGFDRVSNYDGSMWDWAAADTNGYPMKKMENYQALVYPAWVKSLIDYHTDGSSSEAPAGYGYPRDHNYLIFETQWGSFEDMEQGWADDSYLLGHIPGAIHSNSDTYENGFPRWFLLPEDELKEAVGSMGITDDTTVVVYSSSPIFAARLWWILKYAGVEDVRILNGGYSAWMAAGYEEETTINEAVPVTYDGTLVPGMIADTDYVETAYQSDDVRIADVRTYAEYTGETSGYGYLVNKGRVPGAVWAHDADSANPDYLDADGTLTSSDNVRDLWATMGIESTQAENNFDKEVIFYCGGGYRSSLSYLYAYLMGFENVRNYSDGWMGWSTHYVEDASYLADASIPGSTDGWIQEPSGRPVADGVQPE